MNVRGDAERESGHENSTDKQWRRREHRHGNGLRHRHQKERVGPLRAWPEPEVHGQGDQPGQQPSVSQFLAEGGRHLAGGPQTVRPGEQVREVHHRHRFIDVLAEMIEVGGAGPV